MRYVYWTVAVVIAVVLADFAASNPGYVEISFWPFAEVLVARLYLAVLLSLLVGFFFGELVAWINAGRWRREARRRAKRIDALEREVAAKDAQLAASRPPPSPSQLPALPRD